MRYVLLAYSSEERGAEPPSGWHELEDGAMATTIRIRDDTTLVTDGPFAETGERLNAVRVIEAESLDEAIGVAERIPTVRHGVVEVRPVVHRGTEAAA